TLRSRTCFSFLSVRICTDFDIARGPVSECDPVHNHPARPRHRSRRARRNPQLIWTRQRSAIAPVRQLGNTLRGCGVFAGGRDMRKQDAGFDYHRYQQLLAEAVDENKRLALIALLIEERARDRLAAQRESDRGAMTEKPIAKAVGPSASGASGLGSLGLGSSALGSSALGSSASGASVL